MLLENKLFKKNNIDMCHYFLSSLILHNMQMFQLHIMLKKKKKKVKIVIVMKKAMTTTHDYLFVNKISRIRDDGYV